ncbi:LPD25 domain-containing protein [Vibrio aphrogenes]|uniref:LPD25 domain-containing protein n=1 Tax=Vibrio aphrogenes TaxID=1891186 RepID=UPI000B355407|nr:LPD25 domain-containing protein [Vibrio aphrogenes]
MKPSITPKTVYINWSESNELNTGEVYPFAEFEKKALSIALTNPLGGYDKTNVTVTFSDNSQHQCRLDLGCMGNDLGFNDHCLSIHAFHQKNHDNPNMSWMQEEHQRELIQLIESYQLDRSLVQYARENAIKATEEAKQQEEIERLEKLEEQRLATEEQNKQQALFQQSLVIPDWAKGVIIATFTVYDHEESDPYSCEHFSKTEKCIILSWSTHAQKRFPELRKACLNHPDTEFLNDKEQGTEHRNDYGLGFGFCLTNKSYRHHGWEVSKQVFWDESNKAKYVPLGEVVADN